MSSPATSAPRVLPQPLSRLAQRAGSGNWPWKLILVSQVLIGLKALIVTIGILTLEPLFLLSHFATQGLLFAGVIAFVIGLIFIMRGSVVMRFAPGAVIFDRGEGSRHVYVVTRGTVEVVGREENSTKETARRVEQGEYFGGLIALGYDLPPPLRATAVSEAEVLRMSLAVFMRYHHSVPEVREHLKQHIESWKSAPPAP